MTNWLLAQLQHHGDQPDPRFALPATLNWMRALAILCDTEALSNAHLDETFSGVKRRTPAPHNDVAAFERLLMGVHNHAAISSINASITNRYEVVRTAIVAWYYAIHGGAAAMVRSASGSGPEDHQKLIRAWHSDIVSRGLAVSPFGIALSSVVEKKVRSAISLMHNGSPHPLHIAPRSQPEAKAALFAYLSGTAAFERDRCESSLKETREFKQLGVNDFRKRVARELRDSWFDKRAVNFLGQAFRYRGKANYRDSIFLSYGDNHQSSINRFTEDLAVVSGAFLRMSARFVRRRAEASAWGHYVNDLQSNLRIIVDLEALGLVA